MSSVNKEFAAALDRLVHQIRQDRSILAALLCGSLSHDTVWAKSDIDLVLITVDDKKGAVPDIPLYADGVNVHALLMPRAEFRKVVEGAVHTSFIHSFLAKGRLLYSHDPTIEGLCERLQTIGSHDRAIAMLRAASSAVPPMYKARKWLETRKDYAYTSLWILYTATPIARMEVIGAGQLPDREVIPQAAKLKPELFEAIYTDLLREGTVKETVERALLAVERHLAAKAPNVFAPVIEYLKDCGDVRSSRDIEDHFSKNFDVQGVTGVCEYLADLGLIAKASTPVLLTKRSNTTVEELAFFHAG